MRRTRHDRGAALLELAIVLPVLAVVLVGTFELGRAWVSSNQVDGAVFQAARMGASAGSRVEADRDVLIALRTALPPDELDNVDRVVVFRASAASTTVPTGCVKPVGNTSEAGTPDCNTYTGTTLRSTTATSMTGFGGDPTAKDRYWRPASRRDALALPPDYLGVWIRTSHNSVMGIAYDGITITRSAVLRIQPDLAG